jgi:hypothetical protein
MLSYEERENYACKICGAVPDEDGDIEHGRGCFSQSIDGGGYSTVDFPPQRSEIKELKIELNNQNLTMIALSEKEATMIGFDIIAGLENSAIDIDGSDDECESYNIAKGILMKVKDICSEECKREIEDYITEMEYVDEDEQYPWAT